MTLRDYVNVLRERWRVVAIFAMLSLALAAFVTITTPKVYEAEAQVFVAPNGANATTTDYQAAVLVQQQVATFADIIGSPEVLHFIQKDMHLGLTDEQLKGKLRATAPTLRSLVNIVATDNDSTQAAALANSAARGFSAAIAKYMTPPKATTSSVQLHITGPALAPPDPVSPNAGLNLSLGLLLGLLLGIAFAVMREQLDTRVKDPDRLAEAAQAPVIGIVAEDSKATQHPLAARAGNRSVRAENYRQLRANLQFTHGGHQPRVIAVTSSIPGEGKTIIVLNLAWAIGETGSRVCIVDADLRRPEVAAITGLGSSVGLSSVLTHSVELAEAIQPAGGGVDVLTSGPQPPNPSELLGSATMRDVVRQLAASYDYVILDTAPVLPVAAGAEVAAIADGTVLVSRFNVTTDAMVKRAMGTLHGVDAPVLGVVLNRFVPHRGSDYAHHYADAGRPAHAPADLRGRRPRHGHTLQHEDGRDLGDRTDSWDRTRV